MAQRSLVISRGEAGQTVAAVLKRHLSLSWSDARKLVGSRRVRLAGTVCTDPTRRVTAGQRLEVQEQATTSHGPARRPPKERTRERPPELLLHFADRHLVVVDKPAGLTTMRHRHEEAEHGSRGRRFLPPTLADLLPPRIAEETGCPVRDARVIAVHRIDKETTGLVVFARTPEAAKHLGRQFREHTIERRYLALVRGRARAGRIESHFVDDRGDGRRGSGPPPGERAVTHVAVVEELGEFTLVECTLETGRTHQVRIHLGEAGTPLCGERVYDRPLHGRPLPDASGAERIMLHAAVLALDHPATGRRMRWTAALPRDMAELLARLRVER